MRTTISVTDPKLDLVVQGFSHGYVVSFWDESNGNIEVNLSLRESGNSGNAVVDFVTDLLQKAGIEDFSYHLKKTVTVDPVVDYATSEADDYDYDYMYDYIDYGDISDYNLDYATV